MSVLYVPPCPTTCGGSVPPVEFNECTPRYHWGEISKIYIGPITIAHFADVSAIGEWIPLLSATEDDHIRTLTVIGDMPEPEILEVPTSGDRIAIGFRTFSINFEIDETGSEHEEAVAPDHNYTFLLLNQCGGKFKIWFETSDGLLYGGEDGIECSIRMNQIIPRERNALVKIMGKATWKSLQAPFRCHSPLY
jgi:hypothetical protein